MNNNLNVSVTAGLDKPRSVAQINAEIKKIEAQLRHLQLQAKLNTGAIKTELQKQITELNRQKKQLYIDLKIRHKDLKNEYKAAMQQLQQQPVKVNVDTAAAQRDISALSGNIRAAHSETVTLANYLQKALSNAGLVVSAQTALQLIRKAAQEATEAVKEYDKYVTNLSIITGGDRASADNIIGELSEKSYKYKVDVSEMEKAYETLLRTGKASEELDDYLQSTIYLSKVGFTDSSTAAQNLVTIGNAFSLQSDQIEDVVSSLVALDASANTVAGKLSQAMAKVASNAQLAGLSIDELGAIISGLRDTTGRSEEEIATALNSITARLYNVKLGKYELELEDGSIEDISQSLNNTERMLKTVGISLRDTNGEFKEMTDIIEAIVPKWDEFNNVQQNAIASTVAGTYHRNSFISIVENWAHIKDLTEISADSAGQAAEKYGAYLESIEAKTAALSTALKDLYNGIIPRSFIGDLTDAATGIIKFVDEYEVLKNLLKSALFYGFAKGVIAAKNSFVGMVQSIKNVSTVMNLANNSTAMTAERMTQLQQMTRALSDQQLKLVLSNSRLSESEKIKMLMVDGVTEAEAREKLATLGIISTNNAAQVSTLSLSGAFKTLWAVIAANPIGALTMVISAVTMGISTYKQKVEEAREADKQTADQAKETADSISDLRDAYIKAKSAYEDGTGSKDDLTAATDTLLTALGYEKDAVADLIAEYGDLDSAMSKVTAQKLREQLPDLAKGVNAELSELKDEATGHDQALHYGFDITADNADKKELMNFIKDYADEYGGILTQSINSLTTRIDFEGDRGTAEGIKERLENMKGLQQALFDYYGADKVNDIPFYNQLSKRITALTAEYEDYDKALDTYNDTAAKVAVSEYALSHELPKTADEYAEYRKEIIEAARASGDFLGTDAEIVEAIDGVLDSMDGLADIQDRIKNIDLAKSLFGLDNIQSAADGAKMAFINALSDEDLDILVNKIEDPFAEGIEGAKRKITDFKNSGDNEITVEVDTASLEDIYKELEKSAGAIINNSKTVSTALKEIEEHGQLSASSIQAMTAAGYSQALSVNEVTGAITINKSALDKLIEAEKTELKLAIAKASVDLINPYKEQTTSIADLQRELATANEERREEIRLEIARQQAALATAQALDGETEARKKQLADLKALLDSIDAPTFESGSGSGSGSTASKTDANKAAFDAEYAEYKHNLEMGRISESEYLDWLDGAYKKHFSDRKKYAAEWNKYEEEVFKGRKSLAKSAFDDEIESYTGNADRAINKGVDIDGKTLNGNKYNYARAEITKAMTATQSRIDELKASGLKNNEDEIKKLTDDLDRYADKLIDITDKERKAEQDYIKGVKGEYSDLMDDRIDAVKEYADSLKDAYDTEIDALDDQIKAIAKKQKAQKAENDLLEAQNDLIKARHDLDKAQIKNRMVYTGGGQWELRQDDEEIAKAQKAVSDAEQNISDAEADQEKQLLQDQKDLLTEQKESTDKYYDSVTETLEKEKETQEKIYDAVIDLLDDSEGKQTESNTEFISGLTNEDISKAVESLPRSEQQALSQSGIIKDENGSMSVDYSDLDKLPDKIADAVTERKIIPYTQIDPATIKDTQTAQLISLLQSGNIGAMGAISITPKTPALSNGSEVSNYVNVNNPQYKCDITINGNTTEKTVDEIKNTVEKSLLDYTTKLRGAI